MATENQAKIQRTLVGLGIESSMPVVDEWRIVLHERGKCTNIDEALNLLRECVHLADQEGAPIFRPSQSGPWIGKILLARKDAEESAKPKPTASKNLAQIAYESQEADMRSEERVGRFQASWDTLIRLERENGSESDEFHARRRHFASDDLIRRRIRDASERYVAGRISDLKRILEQKDRQQALSQSKASCGL